MERYEHAKTPSAHLVPGDATDAGYLVRAPTKPERDHPLRASWAFELVCAFLSVAAIVAIAAILRVYDGQLLSAWELQVTVNASAVNISLNSVISVLGTLAKSTIAVVLSSGLSQNKWNWYQGKRRPLQDFELFDSASRGPKGSLQLLWRTRARQDARIFSASLLIGIRRIASLGAFLVILSVTFDPFLQLLISYPEASKAVLDPSATLAYAHSYTSGSEQSLSATTIAGPDGRDFTGWGVSNDPEMVGAIYSGLWNKESRLKPTYNCVNGNCTWPTYVSLAVCSKCFDMTHQLSKSNPTNVTYSSDGASQIIPDSNLMWSIGGNKLTVVNQDGFWSMSGGVAMNSSFTYLPKDTFNFQDSQTLLIALAAITSDHSFFANQSAWEDTPVMAMECGLTLCANTYNSTVQQGNYSETVVESVSQRLPSSWSVQDPSFANSSSYIYNGSTWNPIGPAFLYHVDRTDFQVQLSPAQARTAAASGLSIPQGSLDALVSAIKEVFTPTKGGNFSTVSMDSGLTEYSTPATEALWSGKSMDTSFANMATDMTAIIRNVANSSSANQGPSSGVAARAVRPGTLTGTSVQFSVLIAVRWAFFTVPVLICGLGVIFLAAAMFETRRVQAPTWKDRALPGLVWGLDDDTRYLGRNHWQTTGEGRDINTKVTFRGGKQGGLLVQAHSDVRI